MSVQVYPAREKDEHCLRGCECHCGPDVEWIDPDTGLAYEDGPLVIHNERNLTKGRNDE